MEKKLFFCLCPIASETLKKPRAWIVTSKETRQCNSCCMLPVSEGFWAAVHSFDSFDSSFPIIFDLFPERPLIHLILLLFNSDANGHNRLMISHSIPSFCQLITFQILVFVSCLLISFEILSLSLSLSLKITFRFGLCLCLSSLIFFVYASFLLFIFFLNVVFVPCLLADC